MKYTNFENIITSGNKYQIILADPPWEYKDKAKAGNRGAESKYPCMSKKDLMNLPVESITDENCALFMWVTWPHLETGLELIKKWGFSYKTIGFNWIKETKTGKRWFWGMGHYTRSNSEPCLLAFKGKLKREHADVHSVLGSYNDSDVCITPIREHSRKPEEIHSRIERLFGDKKRIELFARETSNGWDCFGNELEKFENNKL